MTPKTTLLPLAVLALSVLSIIFIPGLIGSDEGEPSSDFARVRDHFHNVSAAELRRQRFVEVGRLIDGSGFIHGVANRENGVVVRILGNTVVRLGGIVGTHRPYLAPGQLNVPIEFNGDELTIIVSALDATRFLVVDELSVGVYSSSRETIQQGGRIWEPEVAYIALRLLEEANQRVAVSSDGMLFIAQLHDPGP